MKAKDFIPITVLSLTILLFVSVTAYMFKTETGKKRLPVLGFVADFKLNNQSGKPFGLKNLHNKVWVANFFFTTCGDICPIMSKNIASLNRSYKLVDDVEFVSISVNPEQDDTKALTDYAKRFKADPKKWHFITGPREQIKELAIKSFKVGSAEEPVFHSSMLVLVDRYAQIRGYYTGTEKEDVQTLFKDVALLINE